MTGLVGCAILVILFTASRPGDCKDIASANFTIPGVVTTLQWGQRSLGTSCSFEFSGTTVQASSTYIYMKFNVRVLEFTHYIAYLPDAETTGLSGKWKIIRSDYQYTNTLYFTFNFVYSEYFGAGQPWGECTIYTNYTEALEVANSTPDLPSNEANRLTDTSPLSINYVQSSSDGWDEIRVACVLNPPTYIGLHEAYTRIVFEEPVYNLTSLGTEMVCIDSEFKWFFGRHPAHGGYYDEWYLFSVPAGSNQHSSAQCELWAVSNETLPEIIRFLEAGSTTALMTSSTAGTLPTTIFTATTIPTVTTVSSLTTVTPSLNLTTTAPADTFKIVENFTHTGNRRQMKESHGMRNQKVTGWTELWSVSDSNPLTCGRRCLGDADCLSVFFVAEAKSCHAHNVTFSKGDGESRLTTYYVIV